MNRIAFIGNPTSISFLVGRELIRRGYDVQIYGRPHMFQTNNLRENLPQERPGLVRLATRKYCMPIYWALFERRQYDIELRSFSKPTVKAKHRVVIYHGNDLRDRLWPISYPCFYSTKELGLLYLDLNKNAAWLPRCVYREIFSPADRVPFDGKHLIVGHFPTDPKMEQKGLQGKGSGRLHAAIEVLEQRGIEVHLLGPESVGHKSHEEMPELYRQCHVIADQFLVGQYGVIALEAILMNRPVVCHVPEKHWEYEEMKSQIVNCDPLDPESIADALLKAVEHPVDPDLIGNLYSANRTTDVLVRNLKSWGFLC
jgi:hypothetical protein